MKNLFEQIGGLKVILISAVILLIVSNVVTAFYFYQKNQKEKNQIINLDEFNENVEEEFKDTEVKENQEDRQAEPENIEINKDLTEGVIDVDWAKQPIKIDSYKDDYKKYNLTSSQLTFLNTVNYYKVGTVKGGKYDNKDFLVITYLVPFGHNIIRGIKDGSNIIVLNNYSDRIYSAPYDMGGIDWGFYIQKFIINDNLVITDFDLPESIQIPNSDILLIRSANETKTLVTDYSNLEKLFEYEKGKYIYQDKQNCYIVLAKDGTARQYHFDISFLEKKEGDSALRGGSPNLNSITWNNGEKNKNYYSFQTPGTCGYSDCYNYASYIKDISQLNVAGETNNGSVVYEFKNMDSEIASEVLKNIYNEYGQYRDEKQTYEEFLNSHPLFFWQDPFGGYIVFQNAEYESAVECGKPVIYLYPEQETDVSVWVEPTGGFKITEPKYNNGWKVKAKPNGEIYNYNDEKIYPYLFWEGYGLNYERPKQGFVIAKKDVKEFLDEKLIELGLIKKEADEFMEFWLPRMQEKNYYFITFVPQAEFDKLAPLAVLPKPDTVIRIFMDYEGMDEYREFEEQHIITPERNGFVVVEWGGAVRK